MAKTVAHLKPGKGLSNPKEAKIAEDFKMEDPWRVFRIMAEFVESFEVLSQTGPAVTIFGSVIARDDAMAQSKAEQCATYAREAADSRPTTTRARARRAAHLALQFSEEMPDAVPPPMQLLAAHGGPFSATVPISLIMTNACVAKPVCKVVKVD